MLKPGVLLLLLGILLLVVAGGLLVIRYFRHRKFKKVQDEFPTQLATDAWQDEAIAFLVALDASIRLPKQIPLCAGQEVRLGRDHRSNTVTLDEISISRRHARIIGERGGFIILDEGSRGGTFVNKRRLHRGERHRLQHNEIVQFYTFSYQYVLAEAPTQVIDGESTIPTRFDPGRGE